MWSKDIIFVISDGYMDGMHAWLSAYHGLTQQSEFELSIELVLGTHGPSDMVADRVTLPSGVIWTALNVDYPGHSFSHLGIFHGGFWLGLN